MADRKSNVSSITLNVDTDQPTSHTNVPPTVGDLNVKIQYNGGSHACKIVKSLSEICRHCTQLRVLRIKYTGSHYIDLTSCMSNLYLPDTLTTLHMENIYADLFTLMRTLPSGLVNLCATCIVDTTSRQRLECPGTLRTLKLHHQKNKRFHRESVDYSTSSVVSVSTWQLPLTIEVLSLKGLDYRLPWNTSKVFPGLKQLYLQSTHLLSPTDLSQRLTHLYLQVEPASEDMKHWTKCVPCLKECIIGTTIWKTDQTYTDDANSKIQLYYDSRAYTSIHATLTKQLRALGVTVQGPIWEEDQNKKYAVWLFALGWDYYRKFANSYNDCSRRVDMFQSYMNNASSKIMQPEETKNIEYQEVSTHQMDEAMLKELSDLPQSSIKFLLEYLKAIFPKDHTIVFGHGNGQKGIKLDTKVIGSKWTDPRLFEDISKSVTTVQKACFMSDGLIHKYDDKDVFPWDILPQYNDVDDMNYHCDLMDSIRAPQPFILFKPSKREFTLTAKVADKCMKRKLITNVVISDFKSTDVKKLRHDYFKSAITHLTLQSPSSHSWMPGGVKNLCQNLFGCTKLQKLVLTRPIAELLCGDYNLDKNMLPKSLTELYLEGFEGTLNDGVLPENLQVLDTGDRFDQEITAGGWLSQCPKLVTVKFGKFFTNRGKDLQSNCFPSEISTLDLGRYKGKLSNNILPKSVQNLKIWRKEAGSGLERSDLKLSYTFDTENTEDLLAERDSADWDTNWTEGANWDTDNDDNDWNNDNN